MGLALTAKQRTAWEIFQDPWASRILNDGGSRSGKTDVTIEKFSADAIQYPGSRQLIARKHINAALRSIWRRSLRDYLFKHIDSRLYKFDETNHEIIWWNGSIIEVSGLDDKERVEKILGNEYLNIFLNEATQLSWKTVQLMISRLAQVCRDPNDNHIAVNRLFMDCNPRSPQHWLYQVGVKHIYPDSKEPLLDIKEWRRLSWSAYDNLENLTQKYIDDLGALPEVARKRLRDGIWAGEEGNVYEDFNEDIHIIDDISPAWLKNKKWEIFSAIDFGYTNPFVYLLCALDEDGRLYIVDEHYQRKWTITKHAKKILEIEKEYGEPELRVSDHDAGDRAELAEWDIETMPANKEVRAGIDCVLERLQVQGDGRPRIFVCRRCEHTINEFYDYMWKDQKEGRNADEEPKKENDHAMDGIRYLCMQLRGYESGDDFANPFSG